MPAPYRDTLPRLEWSETVAQDSVIASSAGDLITPPATRWQDDPNWSLVIENGGVGSWFQSGSCAVPSCVAWIDAFVFGSHTPVNQHIVRTLTPAQYPQLSAGLPVRLQGVIDWYRYTFAVAPVCRVYCKINGLGLTTIPGGLTSSGSGPQPFAIDALADGSGNVAIEFGIYLDNGVGSASIGAFLQSLALVEPCQPAVTNYRLDFAYPIEDVRSYRRPRGGSRREAYTAGYRAARLLGHDGVLEGEVRWVPAVSGLALPLNDGWEDRDDAGTVRAGWARFLRHALAGGAFTFYPDKDDNALSYPCAWAGERSIRPPLEDDQVRGPLPFRIRTTNGALIAGYSQ